MTYASQPERQALIAGFRAVADFLETTPDVPTPKSADILVFPLHLATYREKKIEIDVIASRIGSGTEISYQGRHYIASRKFGPVEYRAVAIPQENREEW